MNKINISIFKTFFLSLCIIATVNLSHAQTASILPPAKTTFVDQNGKPLTSGTVDFYIPSTTTRKTTWQDAGETIPNTNPVVLDAAGRALILGSGSYRQVVKDRLGNIIWDQATSSTGSGGGSTPTATGDGDLVGTIKPWAGMVAPNQYAFAYGQEVSRTTFALLFAAITSSQSVFCNSGSPVLAGLSDTTNFWVGMSVEISCVAAGFSTIVSKTSSTVTLAVNANVTVNSTGVFFPWGRGNGTTTFNLPDFRGFAIAGNNNMGGVASSRLTTTFFGPAGPNGTGSPGGNQASQFIVANLPVFAPTGTVTVTNGQVKIGGSSSVTIGTQNGVTYAPNAGSSVGATNNTLAITQDTTTATFVGDNIAGAGASPFSIVQPTKTANYIVKITPDANSATASGVTSLGGMTGDIACGTGLICTGNIISAASIVNHFNTAVYATDFGVLCDGSTDDSIAAQAAITFAAGRLVVFPAGTCVISTMLTYYTNSSNAFTQGLQITGQGREKTIFDNRVANGFLFDTNISVAFTFQTGITFSNFKIISTTSSANSGGIRVNAGAYVSYSNLQITGLTGSGITMTASAGDSDASFVVSLDRVRVDSVGKWCWDFYPSSGGYFGSNLNITNSSCQSGGTLSASVPPTSGGMRFDGLIANLTNVGFTTNNNVALYIAGADTSVNVTIIGTAFENTKSSVLPAIYADGGLRGLKMMDSQCLQSSTFLSQGCLWLNTTAAVQGDILIENHQVRVDPANNPYVAFQANGGHNLIESIKVRNIYWGAFDTTGQTRFSGFTFDPIEGQAKFLINGTNSAILSGIGFGFTMPMQLGTVSGEWVAYQLPSGSISISGFGGLTANTSYNFYLYNSAAINSPIVGAIEVSATGPTSANPGGYKVKTGDSTRLHIGSATTDASGNFQANNIQNSTYPPSAGTTTVNSNYALSAGQTVSLAASTTAYAGLGFLCSSSNEVQCSVPIAYNNTTISRFYASTQTAPGGATTTTFTLRKNAADTLITCQLTSTATTCNDLSHSVLFSAGDLIDIKMVTSAGTVTTTGINFGIIQTTAQ